MMETMWDWADWVYHPGTGQIVNKDDKRALIPYNRSMEALKIKKHIDSEILNLSVPKAMIGKDVEIIVLVESDDIKESQVKKKREPGSAKGLIWMADDFEKPLDDDMLAEFYK